jgi:hypothetical protein
VETVLQASTVTALEYDGSSWSSEADSIVGMNDHGAWGTATEAYFMEVETPAPTGVTGPNCSTYYNGTSWTNVTSMLQDKIHLVF